MFFSANRSLSRVRTQLARMRELAARPDGELFAAAPCSGWSPSEHIDHSIRVCASIVLRILDAEAPRGERRLSAAGRIILVLGRIPRGRGKSPERVRGLRQTRDELHASLDKLEGKLALLATDHLAERRGPIVPHPRFGGLIPSQALRFAAIHNDHHLRIVDDILKTIR